MAMCGLSQSRRQQLALPRRLWEGFPKVGTLEMDRPKGREALAFTGRAGEGRNPGQPRFQTSHKIKSHGMGRYSQ